MTANKKYAILFYPRIIGHLLPYLLSLLVVMAISPVASEVDDGRVFYSTYLGGSSDDIAFGIALDARGNIYTTGYTRSYDLPVTAEAFQKSNARFVDSFILRVNNFGMLSYATYLGGNGFDHGRDIAVDQKGNIYITGFTNSTDFPIKNALQRANAGMRDAFIIKLSPEGSVLFSTYLGGSGDDVGNAITVDGEGNIYVAGRTTSTDFPLKDPLQRANAGDWDIFITKISPDGESIIYSTYLGGSGWDEGRAIAIGHSGNLYVAGHTGSTDLPTKNPLQKTYGGETDVVLVKISAEGRLRYSTYLGGEGFDSANSIALDSRNCVYVTGNTASHDFPLRDPLQKSHGGKSDAFVIKINPEGNTFLFSTFIGGSSSDNGRYLVLDSEGNIYITGYTESEDFPLKNPLQEKHGGKSDAFIIKIDPQERAILFSTYLGGTSFDEASGIAFGHGGNIYMTGTTESRDFPIKNPFQKISSSYPHAFVTKINLGHMSHLRE